MQLDFYVLFFFLGPLFKDPNDQIHWIKAGKDKGGAGSIPSELHGVKT